MPPAVSPVQGSRSGLITTVIVSVTIAVIMIVIAVYYSQEANKSEKALADLKQVDRGLYYEGAPGDQKVRALDALKDQFPGKNSALEIAMAQSEQLAGLVGGGAQQAKATLAAAAKRVAEVNDQKLINFTLSPNASMAEAVTSLSTQLVQVAQDKKNSDDQLAAARKANQDQIAAQKVALDDKDKQIADANTKVAAAEQKATELQAQLTAQLTSVTQTGTSKLNDQQAQIAKLTNDLVEANKKLSASEKMVTGLKGKLHLTRVNPAEAVVQHPDGNIVRVADNNTCFINIGHNQSVTLGLTFEVYDKSRGIPPLGDGLSDTNMPVGKASIEVIGVGPDTSQCRIIKTQPGQQVVVGDPVSNLVFDPNTKYNFVVYGNFDLSGSGAPSPSDAEIVKRLITQWGGKLQDTINVDTDFVVMGVEPVLPPGLDPGNPQDQLRKQAYDRQHADYVAHVTSAAQLSVPIMNQNRFLYLIGYYDQARR